MATEKKGDVRAPMSRTGAFGSKSGGGCSFEAYFLRDLYRQGPIDDQLIKEIVKKEKLDVSPEDVIKVIGDTSGMAVPRGLTRYIADLAAIVVEDN